MREISRREFLTTAAALGASCVWAAARARRSKLSWAERRDLYPEGVASGDPRTDSVLLWTRRPPEKGESPAQLTVEVAEDPHFHRVIANSHATVLADSDWTCRVLVGGLSAAREYWYRFVDDWGRGSRVGRTLTAPADDDRRPVRFAFVSCQNCNVGAQNAYRRMIYEDEHKPDSERLGFVLHLGDYFYELVWYPEDRPQGMYDRSVREIVRYPHGEMIQDFHIPTDVDDYRAIYRAYLHDPDVQDARARWPFVNMFDNHEFSWLGWQSLQKFDGVTRPRQSRKVAANQAWFEYQAARVKKPSGPALDRFDPPKVSDAPIERFDDSGLGQEPNNLAALRSLTAYRAIRWGSNVEILLTDQRSYRSEDPIGRAEAKAFTSQDFPQLIPEEAAEILDAGRAFNRGEPPASISFAGAQIANFRKDGAPQSILGAEQKRWFLDRLASSRARWKIWGNTIATLDLRTDPQNIPRGLSKPWPGAGYAVMALNDFGTAYVERSEVYDWVRDKGISGFVTVAGDRHSFCAGLAARTLPPRPFEPVGIAFVTGSISAPGVAEALEHGLPKNHPLRALYLADLPGQAKPEPTINTLMLHGVLSCLEFQRSGARARALEVSNPELAPHLSFLDFNGHGYSVVCATSEWIDAEFVCIPRPIERSRGADGGPLRYRVSHRARPWRSGQPPQLEQRILEGDPGLAV